MNDPQKHYHDRKLELALGELLKGEAPPDLSEQILAAQDDSSPAPAHRESKPPPGRWRRTLAIVVAASLLAVLAGVVISVDWFSGRADGPARTVATHDETHAASDSRESAVRIRHAGAVGEDDDLSDAVEGSMRLGIEAAEEREYGPTPASGEPSGGIDLVDDKLRVTSVIPVESASIPFDDEGGVASRTGQFDEGRYEQFIQESRRILSAQRGVVASKDEVQGLRGRIRDAQLDADGQFRRVAALTDQVRQARTVRERLEGHGYPLFDESDRRREVMQQRGITTDGPQDSPPPAMDGIVTAVSGNSEYVEISLGTDDGLRKGHLLDVHEDGRSLGRIAIVRTTPDRAVGIRIPEFKSAEVRRGNRVTPVLRDGSATRPSPPATGPGDSGKQPPKKTWRRAKASPNATRLVIGDKDELLPAGVQANVVVDGFRARVLLDWFYYNDRSRQLEGTFKLRLPNDASLYYLAFGPTSFEYKPQSNQLASVGFVPPGLMRSTGTGPQEILDLRRSNWDHVKVARMVPRQKAANAYRETVQRRVDPALAEWSGAGVFQCRVYPLLPSKLHRIVVGYDLNLTRDGEDLVYHFDVPEGLPECAVDLNVAAVPGVEAEISPAAQPFTSGGRAYYHLAQPSGERITLQLKMPKPVLLSGEDSTGSYFATRVRPELPAAEEKACESHALFLVDTSLSSRPEKFNTYLDLLKSILDANRGPLQHFAVLFFNVESHWWQEGYTKNTAENADRLIQYCHTLSLEGATDLKQALTEAAQPAWHKQGAGKSLRSDLFLLSDGAVTWGEDNLAMIGKVLAADTVGALFAYKAGQSGADSTVLDYLARETGGAVFSIASDEEIAAAATAHSQRPWVLLDASLEGGSDLLLAGRPRTIYPDQQLTVVGRGTPAPQAELVLKFKRRDQQKTVRVAFEHGIESGLAPRAYGQVAVGQLEDVLPATDDLPIAYARHFRVTRRSCSLLMLDREADYQRFQIKPEDDWPVIRTTPAAKTVLRVLDETAARRTDPKAAVIDWLDQLEQFPGFELNFPLATRAAVERMSPQAFEVQVPPLRCRVRQRIDLPEEFARVLDATPLDYDAVAAEAERRLAHDSPADALKAFSSLIENSPGDMVLLRDVAYSAMDWGFGGQAYPLLRRVAWSRPNQPAVYTALARCLAEAGNADLALIHYEVASNAQWANRYKDFHKIAQAEYVHLLRRIESGELQTSVPEFAQARLDTLSQNEPKSGCDLIVVMQWNTDRTDVDLHIVEPSGEKCYYEHTQTKSGGRLTDDVTEGFGPEMYRLAKAPRGKYTIHIDYFAGDQNRTSLRTKAHLTIYRGGGTGEARVEQHTVTLKRTKETREVATVGVGGGEG